MEAYENMKTKTKIVLTIVGVSAVLVPAALLIMVSQNTQIPPQANDAPRQIDQTGVGETETINPGSSPLLIPTPSPNIATSPPVSGGNVEIPAP